MMKKIMDILGVVALVLLFLSGSYLFIYEWLIWDKSVVPDILDDVFMIMGYLSIAVIIVCVIYSKWYDKHF